LYSFSYIIFEIKQMSITGESSLTSLMWREKIKLDHPYYSKFVTLDYEHMFLYQLPPHRVFFCPTQDPPYAAHFHTVSGSPFLTLFSDRNKTYIPQPPKDSPIEIPFGTFFSVRSQDSTAVFVIGFKTNNLSHPHIFGPGTGVFPALLPGTLYREVDGKEAKLWGADFMVVAGTEIYGVKCEIYYMFRVSSPSDTLLEDIPPAFEYDPSLNLDALFAKSTALHCKSDVLFLHLFSTIIHFYKDDDTVSQIVAARIKEIHRKITAGLAPRDVARLYITKVGKYGPSTLPDGIVSPTSNSNKKSSTPLPPSKSNNKSSTPLSTCEFCHAQREKMQICSGCKKAHYCCAEHQKADWKVHKLKCHK
jgi:hypothetical protein